MPPFRYRFWPNTIGRRLIALLLVAACGAAGLFAQSGTNELPFTIQRVIVPPQWVAKELDKVTQGTLQAMPLADFETRLQQIRKALLTREHNARLTQSYYTAELIDRSLTNGKGRWTITDLHSPRLGAPGRGVGGEEGEILPIDSLNLAIHNLNWEQGGAALLGEFEGESLGLLLNQPGNQVCTFDWSARGGVTSDGLSFLLRAPACPMTTFDLTLPVDLWLVAPSSALLVSGPLDSPSAGMRLWKIQATGQSQVEFHLRKISDPKGATRTIFSQVQTTHQLAPDRITHEYDFNLDILHGSVRDLIFEGDGDLEPFDVSLKSGEVQTWKWETLSPKTDPKSKQIIGPAGQLTVSFRQPVQGKITGLKIRALAPVRQAGVWISPGLRVRGSLSRGETLKIQVHPDLQIVQWDHGSFHLNNIAPAIDGGQIISLAEVGAAARRPSFLRGANIVDLSTKETNLWRLDSRGALLSTGWTYSMHRGSLHQLTVRLPDKALGYQVESIDMQPPELLRGWHTTGNYLTVELKQALVAGKKAVLKIALRAPFREIAGGARVVQYPAVEPGDSTRREGTLAITVEPIFQAQLVAASIPLARMSDVVPAKSSGDASYLFTFRDQSVSALLRLIPQPVQVALRGKQSFVLSDRGATVHYRWEAEPLLGAPEFLDFRCTDRSLSSWQVKDDPLPPGTVGMRIHRWERLYIDEALPHLLQLGSSHGINAAALEHALPGGALWRFHLTEPLRKKAQFTLEATVPAGITLDDWRRASLSMPNANPWAVIGGAMAAELLPRTVTPTAWTLPLLTPVQRLNVSHDVSVESPHESIIKTSAQGMRMVGDSLPSPLVGKGRGSVHSLTYHADHTAPGGAASLKLWTDPHQTAAAANEACDEARLTITATADGRLLQHVHFRLWHWHSGTCTLRFPPETQIVGVKLQRQWLDRVEVREQRDGVAVVVPIDQNAPFVRCEVFARVPMGSGFFPSVGAIAVPRIDWPVQPSEVRTRFHLAEGLVPLNQERMTRVGIPEGLGNQFVSRQWLGRAWNWGHSWFVSADRAGLPASVAAQKQTLLNAETRLRGAAKKDLLLGNALERLAMQYLTDETPLIVDRYALEALGLTPTTLLAPALISPQAARPFWEGLGLVHVPSPSGALLTSPRRLEAFGLTNGAASEELDAALLEALRHGRDSSTALVPAFLWSSMPTTSAPGSETTAFRADGSTHTGEMIEWELLPGKSAASSVFVVDASEGRLIGWLAAVLVGIVIWRIQRVWQPLACLRIYLLLVTAGLLLAIWMPITLTELVTLPALIVACAGFGWFLFTFAVPIKDGRTGAGSTMIKPPYSAGAAVLVAVFILGTPWFTPAQPPAVRSYTVLVVEGKTTTDPKQALVPAELVARLDELEQAANVLARTAVVTRAGYVGQVKDQVAVFEAVYNLIATKDHAELVVPLAGVQLLEGALLDKTPAFPTIHKNGYLIKIPAKGSHTLRLPFSVRVSATGDYVDLPFTIPKLAHSEITLRLPAAAQAIHSLHGWGEESFLSKPDMKEWRAQVGYESRVHLRWSGANTTEAAKGTEVNEMHYWDLRPGFVSLSSALTYSVGKGSLSQLVVALPDHLHVRSVDAHVLSPTATLLPISIKNWQVLGKGPQRRLIADLAQPISSHLLLNIEIVPQLSSFPSSAWERGKRLALALPAPIQGKSVLGQVAYNVGGIDVTELHPTAQNLSVQNIPAEEFVQAWKKQGNQRPLDLAGVSRAYRFERKSLQAGLELDIQPVARQVRMELSWKVEPHHADLAAKLTLASAADNIIVQDVVIPATFTLANVAGADVAFWQVRDQLLQVWFRRPCKQTEIELTGWQRLDADAKDAGGALAKGRFIVPAVYPLNAQLTSSTLHVIPAGGVTVQPERLVRLQTSAPGLGRYAITDHSYEAEFRVNVSPSGREAHLLTKLHPTGDGIEIGCAIRLSADRGQLPPLKLHVKDWPGATLILDAPGASVLPLKNSSPSHRVWTIKHGAGLPHDVLVTVRGLIAKEKHADISLPVVEVDGVPFASKWIQWKDVEIVDAATGKKLADGAAAKMPFALPDAVLPHHVEWRQAELVGPAKASLPNAALLPKIHILHRDEQLAPGERGQWVHDLECWVAVQETGNLHIRFPAPLEHLNVVVDQELRMSQPLATNDYFLPLSASARPQRIRLTFAYPSVSFEQPRIDFPMLGASSGPDLNVRPVRIVWVPARMATASADWKSQPTLIERLLQQADQQVRLVAATARESVPTAEDRSKVALEQQQTFFTRLRQVDYLLAVLKHINPVLDTSAWRQRVSQLKEQNLLLAKEHGYEPQLTLAAEKKTSSHAPVFGANDLETGLPFLAPAGAVQVALRSAHEHAFAESRTRSQVLVLMTLALLVFTLLRQALAILHMLVPEFVSIILIVCLSLFGWGLVGVVAVLAMVAMRLVRLVRIGRVRFGGAPAVADEPSAPPAAPPL